VLRGQDPYSGEYLATAQGSAARAAKRRVRVKADGNGRAGSNAWTVSRAEVEARFASSRPRVKARPGYDLTLRPTKSVSVLWALVDDDRRREIRRAHAEAVDEVVRYYETHAVSLRRRAVDRRRSRRVRSRCR
jgi:hypothetical protein